MNEKAIGKSTIYNTIKTLFGIVYPLITFPYVSRILMAENIGKINFGSSLVGYFSLLASLGVSTYAVRECSKVKYNKEKLETTASQIFSINVFTTIFSYAVLIVLLIYAKSLESYRVLICIQAMNIVFTTLGTDWLNTAMEDFKFITIRTIGIQIISLLLMFIFVKKAEDYIIYAVISVIASSGANIINIIYRRKYCRVKFTVKLELKKHLPPIILLFSLILSQTIYVNSDMVILGFIKGDYQVGLYSTSVRIYTLVNQVVASVAWVVIPQLSIHFEKKNYEEINRLLKHAMNYIILLGIPSIVGLNIITPQLIECIAGKEFLGAVTSLRILTISLVCSFISGWMGNMSLLPSGKEKISLRAAIISAIANIVLNFILIPKFGLNAAAATTAVSEFLGIVVKYPYFDKKIKITGWSEMLKAPVIGGVGIFIVGFLAQKIFDSAWSIALITITLSCIWYLLVQLVFKNEFFYSLIKPLYEKVSRRIAT